MKTWSAISVISLVALAALTVAQEPATPGREYAGSGKCAECHVDIAQAHAAGDHSQTMRRVEQIPELLERAPLSFLDREHQVAYRLERAAGENLGFDLVATKGNRSERLHLIWGLGVGRKGITFVGRDDAGKYGESRVSWYQRIRLLDITTGAEFSKPNTAHDALAGWLEPKERQECFACHVTRHPEAIPEEIQQENAGVQCERCHGPGLKHIEAITSNGVGGAEAIKNPGKLRASEQLAFCRQCHRQPSENLGQVMTDKATIRFPAQRLVLSRCYDESDGKLKCTTCHDPHGQLPASMAAYDPKCLSCHAGSAAIGSQCPVSKKDCVSCHMPVEPLMKHSEFADH